MANEQIPIIDTHIHLFSASELETLAWATGKPSNPLYAQHSISEYRAATGSPANLQGFVFLETDRIQNLDDEAGWKYPLEEVDWLRRIVEGTPREGEGHQPADADLCLGIVPWAPLPLGRKAVAKYVSLVQERAGLKGWPKVKGFRYLVQDKPPGVMLGEGFIDGLKWIGEMGFTFDLGVDQRSGGDWQLEEAVEMLEKVTEGVKEENMVRMVINHQCKPNMRVKPENTPKDASFQAWKSLVQKMAAFPNTCMKLSGGFAELPPQDPTSPWPIQKIVDHIRPWTDITFEAFGTSRVLFASDWPVCNPGGAGNGHAWGNWRRVVETLCEERGLSREEKGMVFSGNARKWYNL
ncbi:MAG: hypothetical protein M1834_002502 [Cirrosporium novae-zelandiae]|nr:MAG: hypothetical protein M1834_002502 [Cirrosporium novae-zelandiae]